MLLLSIAWHRLWWPHRRGLAMPGKRVQFDDEVTKAMRAALVIILLLAILAGAVFVGHYGWVSAGDVVMPAWGWLMLGLGVFFTLLVGGGLMVSLSENQIRT